MHAASEPRRQELFRRLNLAPGGTVALVRMREQLLDVLAHRDADLGAVDDDFVHLFSSWFNRGFLVLRRIDWSTPAIVLEKIIRYEAVHAIHDWDDLRRRIDPPDRRCYAFFHPALVDDPLIFVEVALTRDIPGAIAPILSYRARGDAKSTRRAPRCSIRSPIASAGSPACPSAISSSSRWSRRSAARCRSCRPSSRCRRSPASPPGSSASARRKPPRRLTESDKQAFAALDEAGWWTNAETAERLRDPLMRAAAWYYLRARTARGLPLDPVARFHLGNGARLERIDWLADTSDKAIAQGCGLMVNYLYDLDDIEKNHEAYAEGRTVVASNTVQRLLRAPLELVPSEG